MQFTNEYYALVSQPASIMYLATTYIRKKASYLSPQKIESSIFAREKKGDTYVGNQTIVLHVINEEITQPFVMYLFLDHLESWTSLYSGQKHQVNKIMIVVVNPHHLDLKFAFFSKFFDCESQELLKAPKIRQNKIYRCL